MSELKYEPLADRPSLVNLSDLARPIDDLDPSITTFLACLPRSPGVQSLLKLRDAIVAAHKAGRPVIVALGGHVIKTGCGPYLVDLINRDVIMHVALTGGAAIHDLELAIAWHTSEDVDARLPEGKYGFTKETHSLYASACARVDSAQLGLGRSLSTVIESRCTIAASVLFATKQRCVPCTIHTAIGADTTHMNRYLDGAALGSALLRDFRILCDQVAELKDGVFLNLGSAVIMPEVFLKAVARARNLGVSLEGMTTANMDMTQHYRARRNVLERPGGDGIALTGHHEIMIPLLHAAVVAAL